MQLTLFTTQWSVLTQKPMREWKESNLHLQISHINWNRTNDLTDNLHSIMWFDLQFTLYTVCCLTFQLHSQNYIVATSVIEQLTLSTLTKIRLKCRFSLLFSFTVSITLLYVSHWPQLRVCHYKVFQLSIQYAHWDSILEFPIPRNNIIYKLNYAFYIFVQHVKELFERTYIHSDYSKLLVFRFQVQR